MLLTPKSIGIWASRGELIPVGTMQAFRHGRVPALDRWRDAGEKIKPEIGHASDMTEITSTSLGNGGRLLLKSCRFDRPKIVPNGVDATMVAG